MPGSGSATGLELRCDKCGKGYTHPKRLANHALRCTGKAVPVRGRIDRLAHRPAAKRTVHADRTPPEAGAVAEKRKSKRAAPSARKATARRSPVKRTEPAALTAAGVTPAQMLAALRAEQAKIEAAIAAVEALA